jgi:plasmid stabilization system protein ParE
MRLRLHRRAVEEIEYEVEYYDERQLGLGEALEDEIDAALSLIVQFPEAAPSWKDRSDLRVAVLDRFPFTLPYLIMGDEVAVLALAHTSRRPGYWSRRR